MDIVEIIRWAQVGGLSLGALMSLVFLVLYSKSWALSNHYARFIISLNIMFITSIVLVTAGRIIRDTVIIEAAKALVFIVLAIIMTSQIFLLWNSRQDDNDTCQEESRIPQTRRRG